VNEYVNTRRISYDVDGCAAVFVPVCETCGRFARADETVLIGEEAGLHPGPNATCKRCGRVRMLFEGFMP